MTLQASGTISFEDLKDEFGDVTGSVSFARYYAGTQGEVPPKSGGVNPNVPVSGSNASISINDFYSAQNYLETAITSVGESSSKINLFRGFSSGGTGDMSDSNLYNLDGQLRSVGWDSFGGSGLAAPGRFILVSSNDKISALAWTTCTMLNTTTLVQDKFINGVTALVSPGTPILGAANNYKWYVSANDDGPYDPIGSRVNITFENNGN